MKTSSLCRLLVALTLSLLSSVSLCAATRTLTITTVGSGTVNRNPTNNVYPNGAVVTLTAVASNGWMFSSWSGSVTESINPLNVMMDADKVITATFSPIPTYQVAVEVAGQGSVTPPGGTFLSNTVVMFSANPAAGWVFGRWTGDVSSLANPLELSVSNDTHLTAVFGQPPAISSQPQSATVDAGGTVVFQVEAQGSQPFAYEWHKDGLPLEGATSASLQIANVRAADAGEYRVTVSNDYGATLSQGATLTLGNSCGGPNVVTACNEAQLRQAVSQGGVVRFCCNGTILLTDTIEITRDVALDGQQFAVSISGNNAVRLFKVLPQVQFSVTNLSLIDGRHVGANANLEQHQPGEDGLGGAILNEGGTVQLVSCVLSNNTSSGGRGSPIDFTSALAPGMGRGGAVMNVGGTTYIDHVLAVSNSTVGGFISSPFFNPVECGPGFGGALGSVQGAVVISDSSFVGNTGLGLAAQTARAGDARGGAIHVEDGSLVISRSTFSGNAALVQQAGDQGGLPGSSLGGALWVRSSATILESRFVQNRAQGGYGFQTGTGAGEGGAIYNLGLLEIENSSFDTNQALAGNFSRVNIEAGRGGALYNAGTVFLAGSTLHHNSARGGAASSDGLQNSYPGGHGLGGGIFNLGQLRATNCTIVWNQTQGGDASAFDPSVHGGIAAGGGVYNGGTNAFLMNVTAAHNAVRPGLRSEVLLGANLANTNGVLSLRNTLVAYGDSADSAGNAWGVITDDGYNLSSDGSCNFQSGSSFNFTDPKLDELADYGGPTLTMALLPESPAIDFGTASGAPATDQRGVTRPSGNGVDIGAFELGPSAPALRLFIRRDGLMVEISFMAQAGRSYDLESSHDLHAWGLHETIGPVAATGKISRSIPADASQEYFRLKLAN